MIHLIRLLFLSLFIFTGSITHADTPQLIPWPQESQWTGDSMTMPFPVSLRVENPELTPLANLLAGEAVCLFGSDTFTVAEPNANTDSAFHGIVLAISPDLPGDSYHLKITENQILLQAGSYASCAWGTATILQLLEKQGQNLCAPQGTLIDKPAYAYRGLMIDLARSPHSIGTIKQMIVLCRFYKINYLHLHFTDDQAFTFPATAIPELAGKTRQYTLAELRDLENFAHDRGVIILPEIDLPGHSACLVNAVPERFANDPQADNVLCPGRENVYEILDQVIAEMVDVFPSSPYIHIGADEVVSGCWESCSRCREYMQKNEIPNKEELYRHFLVRMNDLVKKHGKKTMVWEGFAKDGQIKIPNDITVMVFESLYNIAPDLIAGGYPIVNATWQPLYIVPWKHWSAEEIYKWHPLRWESWVTWSRAYQNPIIIEPTPLFQGCQLCSWEQADGQEWPTTRDRLPAMSERAWNPNAEKSFEDFSHRFQTNDARLQLLLP